MLLLKYLLFFLSKILLGNVSLFCVKFFFKTSEKFQPFSMNRLPSSSSFQGVLDSIIRNYLLNELPPNGATRHQVAEKDLDQLQTNGLHVPSNPGPGQNGNEVNNNTQPHPGTSSAAANRQTFPSNTADHEYIKAIYQRLVKIFTTAKF